MAQRCQAIQNPLWRVGGAVEWRRIAAVHARRHAGVMPSLFTWRGTDDPDRIDHASVSLAPDSMSAHGVSVTPSYAASWNLDVASETSAPEGARVS